MPLRLCSAWTMIVNSVHGITSKRGIFRSAHTLLRHTSISRNTKVRNNDFVLLSSASINAGARSWLLGRSQPFSIVLPDFGTVISTAIRLSITTTMKFFSSNLPDYTSAARTFLRCFKRELLCSVPPANLASNWHEGSSGSTRRRTGRRANCARTEIVLALSRISSGRT